jgi:glyoxalase family protein
MELGGLHHVTAVTGNAPGNLAFYTGTLGMRLVKKTVNQDDVSAYHLFYADNGGSAGTEVTFFDWPNAGPNVPGTGTIAAIGLRVPGREALEWWEKRLDEQGVTNQGIREQGERMVLPFTDPEGQRLVLVADEGGGMESGEPWPDSPVPAEMQIRGLDHMAIVVRQLTPTATTLTEVLGFRQAREYTHPDDGERVIVFETGPGGHGTEVHVHERPALNQGRVGIGGVHHIAFRVPNDEEHRQWRDRVANFRLGITDVIDRFYFRSLYFREPGHVLYELATDGPGFAVDEDAETLGEKLALPPFLEPHRQQIEAGLKPLDTVPVSGN